MITTPEDAAKPFDLRGYSDEIDVAEGKALHAALTDWLGAQPWPEDTQVSKPARAHGFPCWYRDGSRDESCPCWPRVDYSKMTPPNNLRAQDD